MKPIYVDIPASDTTRPIPLDTLISPFQVSVSVGSITGSIGVYLEYTYDDVFAQDYDASAGNWFEWGLMSEVTVASDTVINGAPVTAVRFVNEGNGTAVGTVIQAGR